MLSRRSRNTKAKQIEDELWAAEVARHAEADCDAVLTAEEETAVFREERRAEDASQNQTEFVLWLCTKKRPKWVERARNTDSGKLWDYAINSVWPAGATVHITAAGDNPAIIEEVLFGFSGPRRRPK